MRRAEGNMKLVAGTVVLSLAAAGCLGVQQADTVDLGQGPGVDFDGGFPFVGPQPQFGPTVSAATPPPPLAGGTLLMLNDGKTALAADPDRDQVYFVDVTQTALSATLALNAGDEPGRAVEDAAGKVHLVLRRAGVVATIDPATATVSERTAVCPAPRGIAYEAATDRVHVACSGGELVSLPAAGGAPVQTVTLDRDLRDVLVVGGLLWVSTFRTAQILIVTPDGTLSQRLSLPHTIDIGGEFAPAVAWRMMTLPDGHVGVVHQRGVVGPVQTTQGGYGGGGSGCGGIVQSAISVIDPATLAIATISVGNVVLPVDFSASSGSQFIAMVSSGNSHTPVLPQVSLQALSDIVVPSGPDGGSGGPMGGGCSMNQAIAVSGEVTALAYDSTGTLWVQTREPASLQKLPLFSGTPATVTLSTDSRADTAWAVFHSNSGASIACASCHPEGGEDARVWQFDAIGPRRTQSLRGHVGGTEPFHWGGELPNFDALVGEVYLRRMAGPNLADDQKQALFAWINAIPLVPQSPPPDADAVARGKALFEDTTHAACTSCHSGPELTNNATVDVGTGGQFQVPRLVGVGSRAPFLHDGCAATLTDRFSSACGGTSNLHGVTSQMTAAQIGDLVAYLQTL
jgi:mono/diheme cytochrome c family protein